MIEHTFNKSFDVYRVTYGDDNKSSESTVATFKGHLQQTSQELTEQLDLSFTQSFTLWCPVDANITEGDTVKDGTYSYSVKDVRVLDYGQNTHKRVILQRHENE